MFVIVPNSLSEEIYAKVDAAIAECPDAASDREVFYSQLLNYFNEHGAVLDFSLVRNAA